MGYTPEQQAFLDEEAKKEAKQNFPQLNPTKISLVGRNPNKPNPEKAGKFFSREFILSEKKYGEAKEMAESFEGIILDICYRVDWKYKENQQTTLKSREFHDWKEPIELLHFDYTGEKTKVTTKKVFNTYADLKSAFCGVDEYGVEKNTPYDLFAVIYLFSPIMGLCKYEAKGMTRSNFFDYQKNWFKAVSETKTLKNVVTVFGVEEDEKGFSGTFKPKGLASPEMMGAIMETTKTLREWQEGWKQSRKEEVKEELPTIQIEEQLADVGLVDKGQVDMSSVPF
jgi:hypothetical protein